jgi:hypothetical protein
LQRIEEGGVRDNFIYSGKIQVKILNIYLARVSGVYGMKPALVAGYQKTGGTTILP